MPKPNMNRHNDFFKVAFSRYDVVEDYIVQFVNRKIVHNLDLQSLTLSNTSYVTPKLEEYFSDIVWECRYGQMEKPIKVAFLFEHKSFVPKFPHVQLLRYMLEIWEECETNNQPLTPIIPIIVYHNQENRHWHYKPFSDYFKDIDAPLMPYIPSFEYQLTDLTALSDKEWGTIKMGLLLHSLKTLQFGTNQKYVLENVKTLFVNVKNEADDEPLRTFLIAQLVYVAQSSDISPDNVKTIIEEIKKSDDMTAYEYLLELANEVATERMIYLGATQKEREVIKKLLAEFPEWDDDKIANLAASTIETVKAVRAELQK